MRFFRQKDRHWSSPGGAYELIRQDEHGYNPHGQWWTVYYRGVIQGRFRLQGDARTLVDQLTETMPDEVVNTVREPGDGRPSDTPTPNGMHALAEVGRSLRSLAAFVSPVPIGEIAGRLGEIATALGNTIDNPDDRRDDRVFTLMGQIIQIQADLLGGMDAVVELDKPGAGTPA
jgi:hypothetical protein